METIKVNMNPNPLDVQTIHASQNDGEARQWGFELHNNGDVIDSSEITDQITFKAYKGGTEQLLPENTSTPATSPFKGDIKYPQGLLTDQEFTYRESPTESDGLAKITDIKGNTLVWNQLVQNGNFVDSSNWGARQSTFTVSDNIATVTPSTEGTERGMTSTSFPVKANHKYLLSCEIKPPIQSTVRVSLGGGRNYGFDVAIQADQWNKCQGIILNDEDRNIGFYSLIINSLTPSQTIQFRNMMVIDLTQMGLDISSPSEFASLFSLPYYDYNTGSMLSFNGTGLKIVGFNLAERWSSGNTSAEFANALGVECELLPNTSYCVSFVGNSGNRIYRNENLFTNTARITCNGSRQFVVLTTLANISKATASQYQSSFGWRIFKNDGGNTVNSVFSDVCVNFNNSSRNGEYEPYTSSTLSLPISTYFPNGMDGVGTAYDELNNSWYAKRMGRIDLGSITYTRTESQTSGVYLFVGAYHSIPNIKNRANSVVWNIKTPLYETVPSTRIYQGFAQNKTIGGYDAQTVRIRDDSFTDATAFKNSLSGQYLVYELATPTETSFTTASLVTENAEIPLSNEDGTLIGKCTEQLSAEPGFHDAKIKLADADGECYSNKIQLHVERSPQ